MERTDWLAKKYHFSPITPAQDAVDVTPDDATDLTVTARSLYIGVTGDVKITTLGGTDVTFTNVPVGVLSVAAKRVWATGTTATGIIALY